jgi:hypothetical protein
MRELHYELLSPTRTWGKEVTAPPMASRRADPIFNCPCFPDILPFQPYFLEG